MSEAPATKPLCKLCGEPMPDGEDMFYYHGYSGPCPKPPLNKLQTGDDDYVAWLRFAGATDDPHRHLQICDSDSPGSFKVYRRKSSAPLLQERVQKLTNALEVCKNLLQSADDYLHLTYRIDSDKKRGEIGGGIITAMRKARAEAERVLQEKP